MPTGKGKAAFSIGQSIKAHANDPIDYGTDFSGPPAGITRGIAQLESAKVGVYKSGDYEGQKYLRLVGTIMEPDTHLEVIRGWDEETKSVKVLSKKEVKVQGRKTSIMRPLCATVKSSNGETVSEDENVALAANEVKKLGGKDCLSGIETDEDFDQLLAGLVEAAPYFYFGTSPSKITRSTPEQRTWENWYGDKEGELVNYSLANGRAPRTVDNSGGTEEIETEEQPTEGEEGDDLDALAEAADSKDTDAQEQLRGLATKAGIPPKKVKDAKNWTQVVEMIQEAQTPVVAEGEEETTEETTEETEEPADPEVGVTFRYKPKDKATGKPGRKAVDVEVIAVNRAKKTVDLKNQDTPKLLYKGVPWDRLEPAEE